MRATIRTLAEHAALLGVALDEAALERFAAYYRLLVRWNERMNLTRITEESDVVAKHFLDSLAIVPPLASLLTSHRHGGEVGRALPISPSQTQTSLPSWASFATCDCDRVCGQSSIARHGGSLVDVGAGAGFPGIPAAIACPRLEVTLIESIRKKCAFLEAVGRELGLSLDVRATRAEDVPHGSLLCDAAVSRATLAPAEWVRLGARLVRPGGLLIVMLGRERPDLASPAGFSSAEVVSYEIPADGSRALVIFRHESNEGAPS